MSITAVIFDLDGTLVDSAPLIGRILNEMRGERQLPPIAPEYYRRWISLGAQELIEQALEAGPEDLPELLHVFRLRYHALPTPVESLFPGARDTIQQLHGAGIGIGLCSNKPHNLCLKVLSDAGLLYFFGSVVGDDSVMQPKPSRMPLDRALSELGTPAARAVFVGDSKVDQVTALNAGVAFAFFLNGYDDGVDQDAARWRLPSLLDIVRSVCHH